MSTATADAPDWFRGDQWQNPTPLVSEVNVVQTTMVGYGMFNVTQWEQLLITCLSSAAVAGTVTWFADAAGLDQIGFQTFASTAAFGFVDVFPVIGPYVLIQIVWNLVASPVTETFHVLPVRGTDAWKRPLNNLVLVHNGGVVVAGGGGTNTQDAAFTTTGRAIFSVGTDSPNWLGSVFPITATLAQDGQLGLVGTGVPSPASSCEVALPAQTVRTVLVNNDAAAHTFRFSLVIVR